MRTRRLGASMVEMNVALAMVLLLGVAIYILLWQSHQTKEVIEGVTDSELKARRVLDVLADNIRNSQPVEIQASPKIYTCVSAASASSITINAPEGSTRYYVDSSTTPGVLKRQVGTATPVSLVPGVTNLTFTYYKSATTYSAPSVAWTETASPNAPTSAERPRLGAVKIVARVIVGTYARELTTNVRLRNSPL